MISVPSPLGREALGIMTVAAVIGLVTPAAFAETPLTNAEKQHVERLLDISYDLLWEDCRDATFDSELNPPSQNGPQTEYMWEMPRGGGPFGPSNLRNGYFVFNTMLREDRICKDGRAGGAETDLVDGLHADVVILSGPEITSGMSNPDPVQRACDKFKLLSILMNEMVHVYQTPTDDILEDLLGCDNERDSDCLSLKIYDSLFKRLESAPGVPHTSLAAIRGEGTAGGLIADCLQRAGVSSAAQLASVHQCLSHNRVLLQDRKDGLFVNQIDQGQSWHTLYYGGRYRSPLWLRGDFTGTTVTREFTLTHYGNSVTYTIPNDGKSIIDVFTGKNHEGCLFVRAITQGPSGNICVYTWTDTDKSGLPDIDLPIDTLFPPPSQSPGGISFEGIYEIIAVPPVLGYANGFMLHDQVNGRLVAYETGANGIDLTGNHIELVNDPLFADPILGHPAAGGFSQYVIDQLNPVTGQPEILFCNRSNVGQYGSTETVVVEIDPVLGGVPPFIEVPLATALGPNAPFGAERFPANESGDLVIHGPANDTLSLFSENLPQSSSPIAAFTTNQDGVSSIISPFSGVQADRLRIVSLNTGREIVQDVPRRGLAGNSVQVDPDLNSNPSELILVNGPPALIVRDPVIPLGPNSAPTVSEISLEPVDPLNENEPKSVRLDAFGQPYVLFSAGLEAPLLWIPGTTPPVYSQSLHDFDGNGGDNDTMVITRFAGAPVWIIVFYLNVDVPIPAPTPLLLGPLPFEPGAIFYEDLDNDGDEDVVIENWDLGSPLCLFNNLDGTLVLGACPLPCQADMNGDGFLDNGDIVAFIALFLAGDLAADMNGDGILDNGDIGAFIGAFLAGC